MRKSISVSVPETPSASKKDTSWISSSLGHATAACCYAVDPEEIDDFYKPARKNQSFSLHYEPIDAELGLAEDHFSRPEGYFGLSSLEELEMAIDNCKEMIMEAPEKTDRRKQLVMKLVQLRLKLQEVKDGPAESLPDVSLVLGHSFELGKNSDSFQEYCEKCCGAIWGVFHRWYRCKNCGFQCHSKCVNSITRVCANTKVAEKLEYELELCPEIGLSEQKYRCAECKRKFVFKNNERLPRLCDYSGMSYCSFCHWNSSTVIPARVIHNWDFAPRKVCRASLQFLKIMLKKPILNVESLNPMLLGFVPELGTVKKLRQDILVMKQYFVTCHAAAQSRLLQLLHTRQHFVESADVYSLQDLLDVASGQLLIFLQRVHDTFSEHITRHCQGCLGKGYICEFCKSDEILFPFYPQTGSCVECNSLFHQDCYARWEGHCPKCARRAKQNAEQKPDV